MSAIVIENNSAAIEQVAGKLYAGGSSIRAAIRHKGVTLKAEVCDATDRTLTCELQLDDELYPVEVACSPQAPEDAPRVVGAWIRPHGAAKPTGFAIDFDEQCYQIRHDGEVLETLPVGTPVRLVLQSIISHARRR